MKTLPDEKNVLFSHPQQLTISHEVRKINLFVESLSIKDFGFSKDFVENILPAGNVRRIGNILSGNRLKEYLTISQDS